MKTTTEMMQTPSRPVVAGGFAGALTVLIVWGLQMAGIETPPEVASAFTTILATGVAHLTRDKS